MQQLRWSARVRVELGARNPRRAASVKIAFLILAHKEPQQVAKLVDVLSSEGDIVLVHLDRSSGAEGFQHLPLIAERQAVTWGGYGMIRATNALLSAANDFDFAYLLSGQCFPLRPVSWLKSQLRDGRDRIEAARMPNPWRPMWRLEQRHANAAPDWARRPLKRFLLNLTSRPNFYDRFGIVPHGGSQWWCLRRETVEAIAQFRRERPDYDRYMRWCHVPDECYFHTLTAHFSDAIGPSLTKALWDEGGSHPKYLTQADAELLSTGEVFAARKFSPETASVLHSRAS
jgi:hypothetical protein